MIWLERIFLAFVAVHVIRSTITDYRAVRNAPAEPAEEDGLTGDELPQVDSKELFRRQAGALATQLPLFYLSVYFAFVFGAFSRELLSPLHIGAGLVAGHIVFALSLTCTHGNPGDSWEHFLDLGGLWDFVVELPGVVTRCFTVAFAEELIWRVALQALLVERAVAFATNRWGEGAAPWAVVVAIAAVAFLFHASHRHFFDNSVAGWLEFLVFAFVLGLIYHYTFSLVLVIAIHALRNIETTYLEYLIKVEELGDRERAAEAVMRDLRKQPGLERT